MLKNDQSRKNILLVEDEAATRDALKLILESEGHSVTVAKNGKEALDYLRHHTPPDLILLDLTTPVLGGFEFRQEQQRDPALVGIRMIVISCVGEGADKTGCLGDVGHVQKPLDGDILPTAIQRSTDHEKPVVLIAEDEKAVGKMLDLALGNYGFGVRLAATGSEAVEDYREHHQSIALVLLDVQMPGLDGPATLAAMQAINPEVQCCFMSGHTGKYSTIELLAMGAAHVLPKPFVSLNLLTRLLWDMIGSSAIKNTEMNEPG
jgi:CheY-like chemotaxis protein